jgi:hypothetical protein
MLAAGLLTAAVAIGGCVYPKGRDAFRNRDRARTLMRLAAGEADEIEAPAERLRRLLNIAEMQIRRQGHAGDGERTLRRSAETIEQAPADALDEHTRIAGWVSISELARRIDRDRFAARAVDSAVDALKAVQPPRRRTEFVRGVAAEIRWLRGKPAAAELLRQAEPWLRDYRDAEQRRPATAAIASDLFLYDDYDGGMAILRVVDSAPWRADTLADLAENAIPQKAWGKQVDFASSFQTHVSH